MATSSRHRESDIDEPPQQHGITLTADNDEHHQRVESDTTSSNSDNITSKDADNHDNADVEAGLNGVVNGVSDHHHHQDDTSTIMRGRRDKHKECIHWKYPVEPLEDHTNPQYLPPILLRFFNSILALPYINRVASYISGPSRTTSHQPRLWSFRYIDQYFERPLLRYTHKWTKYPIVLWIFLIAWFLGTTFIARAAWWNANVGGSDITWLDGTSTYWQRNDGCGLGKLLSLSCPTFIQSIKADSESACHFRRRSKLWSIRWIYSFL